MATSRKGEFGGGQAAGRGLESQKLNADGVLPSASEVFASLPASDGAAAPTAAPRTAAPKTKLEAYYAAFPHTRGQRPSQPHSTIDPEGNERELTVTQKAQNALAAKAADEFDAQEQAKKAANAGGSGRKSTKKYVPTPILATPKADREPTSRTPGVHVEQQMGIKEFGTHINSLHTMLNTHLSTLRSVTLRPEAAAYANLAENHLKDAKFHLGQADVARRGVVIGNKRYSGDAEAAKHYNAALGSLRQAHDALGTDEVQHAVDVNKLTASLPTDHLDMVEKASDTIPILKKGKSFKSIPLAGENVDPNAFNIKGVAEVMGKSSPVTAKIKAGQKGTPRQDKFRVITGKEEKSLGGLPGADVRTTGRNGAVNTPINPKRRASRIRSINPRISGANMSEYKTPGFGEPGASGVQKNPGAAGPLDKKKYEDPNNNRGGRGGAV